jgi:hypothetical protein
VVINRRYLKDKGARLGIDPCGRLIKEENTWLVDQTSRNVQASLHPT